MAVFFTADTHFSSQRTLELSKRPFNNINEMNDILITNWNNTVSDDDIVYHLGDFGDFTIRDKLHGKIKLITGNYEEKEIIDENTDWFNLFDMVYVNPDSASCGVKLTRTSDIEIFNDIPLNVNELILTHRPEVMSQAIRTTGICNLFGHIHGRQMIKKYGLDVGTDAHHYRPISINDVAFYINAILNHYDLYNFD